MATKDCICALNAHLDAQADGYDGNRKFKRVSKKKNAAGQPVRVFADNLHAFEVTGDGPYQIQSADTPANPTSKTPSTAVQPIHTHPSFGSSPFEGLRAFSVPYEPPPPKDRTAKPSSPAPSQIGKGWYFALGGPESSMVEQDWQEGVQCGFYLVRKEYYDQENCIESVHVSNEFDLPDAFEEVMEACFLSWWDVETTRAWLLGNGFETTPALDAMANDLDDDEQDEPSSIRPPGP